MELMRVLPDGARCLAVGETSEERWEIALLEREDGLAVYSASEGKGTREVYGTPWHVGCAVIGSAAAPGLREALALADEDLVEVLKSLFEKGRFGFSDLLDLMDRQEVAYAYRAYDSYGAFLRP